MGKTTSYKEVAEKLRNRIRSEEWSAGQMLPGRRALAAEYNVACATMERVISVLVAENTLFSEDRRGTFVSDRLNAPQQQNLVLPEQNGNSLQATVGIIAKIIPYESASTRESQWPAQVLSALENRLSMEQGITQHYFNLIQGIGEKEIDDRVAVEQLVNDGVDAIVFIQAAQELIPAFQEQFNIPFILVDNDPVDFPVTQIFTDSISGGYQAYMHLKQRGYKSISYLRPFTSNWVENRLRGVQLASSGEINIIPLTTKRQTPKSGTEQKTCGYDLAKKMLKEKFIPGTGIIAPNDAIAEGFIHAASEHKLEAGKDYGIIGFDNYNRDLNLSSLKPPLEQLGQEVALNISRILKGESVPSRSALKPQLIARKSTNGK